MQSSLQLPIASQLDVNQLIEGKADEVESTLWC